MISSANRIQKSFSKAAGRYEEFAVLQRDIGMRLFDTIEEKKEPLRILDVGMGTGWLTQRLRWRFPKAEIIGLDFAEGMVERARERKGDFRILQADARALPFKEKSFDIVVSNLTYQWIKNLPGAFEQVEHLLKDDGVFYFSSFAGRTLSELFESFDTALNRKGGSESFRPNKLKDRQDIFEAVRGAGFSHRDVHSEMVKVHFKNVPELLHWLKNIGASGVQQDIFIGKNFLLRADDFYRRNFQIENRIFASFEAVWVKAKK